MFRFTSFPEFENLERVLTNQINRMKSSVHEISEIPIEEHVNKPITTLSVGSNQLIKISSEGGKVGIPEKYMKPSKPKKVTIKSKITKVIERIAKTKTKKTIVRVPRGMEKGKPQWQQFLKYPGMELERKSPIEKPVKPIQPLKPKLPKVKLSETKEETAIPSSKPEIIGLPRGEREKGPQWKEFLGYPGVVPKPPEKLQPIIKPPEKPIKHPPEIPIEHKPERKVYIQPITKPSSSTERKESEEVIPEILRREIPLHVKPIEKGEIIVIPEILTRYRITKVKPEIISQNVVIVKSPEELIETFKKFIEKHEYKVSPPVITAKQIFKPPIEKIEILKTLEKEITKYKPLPSIKITKIILKKPIYKITKPIIKEYFRKINEIIRKESTEMTKGKNKEFVKLINEFNKAIRENLMKNPFNPMKIREELYEWIEKNIPENFRPEFFEMLNRIFNRVREELPKIIYKYGREIDLSDYFRIISEINELIRSGRLTPETVRELIRKVIKIAEKYEKLGDKSTAYVLRYLVLQLIKYLKGEVKEIKVPIVVAK